jgi:hypothetical protein
MAGQRHTCGVLAIRWRAGRHVSDLSRLHLSNEERIQYAQSDAGANALEVGLPSMGGNPHGCSLEGHCAFSSVAPPFHVPPNVQSSCGWLFGAAYTKALERQVPKGVQVSHGGKSTIGQTIGSSTRKNGNR